MALHMTPEEHDADPPSAWTVRKSGRRWQLLSSNGGVINAYNTRRDAENAKSSGPYFDLYQREGRWFRGEPVPGWKPYAACKPRMDTQADPLVSPRLDRRLAELSGS